MGKQEVTVKKPPKGYTVMVTKRGQSPPEDALVATCSTTGKALDRVFYVPKKSKQFSSEEDPKLTPPDNKPSYIPSGSPATEELPDLRGPTPSYPSQQPQSTSAEVSKAFFGVVSGLKGAVQDGAGKVNAKNASQPGVNVSQVPYGNPTKVQVPMAGRPYGMGQYDFLGTAENKKRKFTFKEDTGVMAMVGIDGGAKVTDEAGKLVFETKPVMEFQMKARTIHNSRGDIVGSIKGSGFPTSAKEFMKKQFAKPSRTIVSASGEELGKLAEEKFKFGNDAKLNLSNGRVIDIKIDLRAKHIKVIEGKGLLAEIERKSGFTSTFMGKDTYTITVYPTVCPAFIVGITTIVDDLFREK